MDAKSLLNLWSIVDRTVTGMKQRFDLPQSSWDSLRQAKQWCLAQKLRAAEIQTPDVARARDLLQRAAESSRSAFNRASGEYDSNHPSAKESTLLFRLIDYKVLTSLTPQLRSPELRPLTPLYELKTFNAIEEAIQELVRKRSGLLAERTSAPEDQIDSLPGRLLLYEPQETVDDGAAQVSSQGFYDVHDAPPWDTWVSVQGRSIVCWIPELLIPLAQAGIDANPVDCIHWAPKRAFIAS